MTTRTTHAPSSDRTPQISSASRVIRTLGIAVAVVALLLGTVGCKIRGQVAVNVNNDGSGIVKVKVGLDSDAVARVGNVSTIRVNDLTAGGWTVAAVDPKPDADGWVWLAAEKPFDDKTDLGPILEELSPDGKLFNGFSLTITDGFGSTTYRINGQIDATGDLSQFSDAKVAAVLEGNPLGRTPDELAAEVATTDQIDVSLSVQLPGKQTSASAASRTGVATFNAQLGTTAPTSVNTTSVITDPGPLWAVKIGAALIGLAAVSLVIAWRRTKKLRRMRRNFS